MDFPPKRLNDRTALAEQAAAQAKKAWHDYGKKTPPREVFVFALPCVDWQADEEGPTWTDWSRAIAVIENVGWRLDQWQVVHTGGSGFTAFPVFRRPTPGK